MITEQRDRATGIVRFEINTVNPEACRHEIEESGYMKMKDGVADTINYRILFGDCEMQVTTTPTRTIIYGTNRYAMLEFYEMIKGSEALGTNWAYDDSKRTDYQNQ